MSLSKRLCQMSPTEVRQSFSERICDDLSEVILQYLPIKEKLRLESVSKQFQRTLFQREYEFRVSKDDFNDLKSLESLLKKCSNITSIGFENCPMSRHFWDSCDYNPLIALITKCCDHLLEFKFRYNEIAFDAFVDFNKKFGSQLKTICLTKDSIKPLMRFRNLEEVIGPLEPLAYELSYSGIKSNKLKKLSLLVTKRVRKCTHELSDNFKNLQFIKVEFSGNTYNLMAITLKDISKLENLIELKIHTNIGLNNNCFADSLKEMANNCLKLKSIECDLVISNDNLNVTSLLDTFRRFKQLKRLKVKFSGRFVRQNSTEEEINEIFSFKLFEGFPNITHLSIDLFSYTFSLGKNSLKNIDIYLPKLQYLEIIGDYNETSQGWAQIVDILSRLTMLETIKICLLNQSYLQTIKEEITRKCRKIRLIVMESHQSISSRQLRDRYMSHRLF